MQALQCPDCGRDFEVPEHFSSEEPLVCPDCIRALNMRALKVRQLPKKTMKTSLSRSEA